MDAPFSLLVDKVILILHDKYIKMIADDGISDLSRIQGVRNIGSPNAFPRTRIVKKKKKKPEEENIEGEAKEGESSGSSGTERHGIDIEV